MLASCSGEKNLNKVRHVLHTQSACCSIDEARTPCHAATRLHQQSGAGAAHSNGKAQLAQRFSIGHR